MGRRELQGDADALFCMGVVDSLLERGVINREDRERARDGLLDGGASPLCVLLTEEPCHVRGPE